MCGLMMGDLAGGLIIALVAVVAARVAARKVAFAPGRVGMLVGAGLIIAAFGLLYGEVLGASMSWVSAIAAFGLELPLNRVEVVSVLAPVGVAIFAIWSLWVLVAALLARREMGERPAGPDVTLYSAGLVAAWLALYSLGAVGPLVMAIGGKWLDVATAATHRLPMMLVLAAGLPLAILGIALAELITIPVLGMLTVAIFYAAVGWLAIWPFGSRS
jgi:hypothetical protein